MRGEKYQIALIFLGVMISIFFSVFFFRELFPEYKIYQNAYIALEKFRSTYTGEHPPPFQKGVKQILMTREDRGPPQIDRCISCHVALQFSHFSPTKIATNASGEMQYDPQGVPLQVPNEEYVWKKLDEKISALKSEGKESEAAALSSLKTAEVGEQVYDMTTVLRAHPLIGKETYPFQYHPMDDWGCVSCHGGNGASIVTSRAHGPIFDGQYEIEDVGFHPEFLEQDPKNDPPFSKLFNHKPGHRLLFQTNPLLVGGLIEAKCAQCHAPITTPVMGASEQLLQGRSNEVGTGILLPHFQAGQELYITQACYACHRIAGFSRGGVGPELTNEGNAYPWFLKESIVWPQADLKTSTMPNFRLDHPQVEDLMTFLLAQHGRKKSESEVDYKVSIQKWDAGAKRPWEEPISPALLQDTRHSMTIFATEGCAACHRLVGFDSNVGYRVQKEKGDTLDFKTLHQEQLWFKNLFPETISGSEIVRITEQHRDEIDKRIVPDVRTQGLLEELESHYPGLIESFYSNFGYALRAKNHLPNEMKEWQKRIERILMMYVQEYGLGRLIGPRPNWSGIYRSDEWLMEHFRQPSHSTAKSIMPAMPFDTTKFYALTHMLNVLAKRNRDHVRQIWNTYGFNPAEAYQLHCSQCHGEYRQGNGPVAEWLYPIPKNLQNATFLRNYTKENVIQAITHGVNGTPMPPWGEIGIDKPDDGPPVLTQGEIVQLSDWLFAPLLGHTVISDDKEVPKWQYSADDVNRELQKLHKEDKIDIFDQRSDLYRPGQNAFYIKKVYDTAQNRLSGKLFFEQNCAVCHGNEGDGQGIRAGTMVDAKPRMLTNLAWAKSRDDLRLLRSIKYGVPGTSMTPWGDLTNPLQRLQLVLFIRSLTEEQRQRELLESSIYEAFDKGDLEIDAARIDHSKAIDRLEKQEQDLQTRRNLSENLDERVSLYKQELSLDQKKTQYVAVDQLLKDLEQNLKKQKKLYQVFGESLLGHARVDKFFADYLKLLKLARLPQKKEMEELIGQMQSTLNEAQKQLDKELQIERGKLPSQERTKTLEELHHEAEMLEKTKRSFASLVEQKQKLDAEQASIYETYRKKNTELTSIHDNVQ